jgi:hypothetical protein
MRLRGKMLIVGGLVLLALCGFAAAADGNASGSAPGANSFLWGAWIGPQFTGSEPPWNWQAVKAFEARNARGKHVNLVHWGVGTPWGHEFRYWLGPLNRARSAGAVSLIDMDTASVPLRNVADGAYDSALRTWASQARSWGHPLLLRFDWEMNGSWFPWGTRPSNLNTAAEFVAAWRHVHDVFAGAGASNVLWVWCPNAIPPRHAMTNPVALYPGDAYVNWTCLDAYNFDKPWTSFSRLFAASYRLITQLAPTKPMLVGEVASTGHGGSKARWIRNMFKALATRFRAVRGLAWYDKWGLKSSHPRDWPIETSKAASAAFSRGIARELALSP